MNDAARSAYEAALKLTDKTARTIWSVFSGLLAVNAFLISFAAFFFSSLCNPVSLTRIVGALGLLVCLAWALIMMRSFDFYAYYFAWARKFEKDAFGEAVEMIRCGQDFARGDTVNLEGNKIRLRWGSRLFKVEWLVYTVIASFAIVYAYIWFNRVKRTFD
jgi:hypothetical protein